MHVLFECTSYAEQTRDLEAKLFKLGHTQVTYDLLNPPSKHRQEVVQAVIVLLEERNCLDRI